MESVGAIENASAAAASVSIADIHPPHCQLLGEFGDFGWWLQGLLGIVSFASLFWKRTREKPQRRLKVFLFDASKQASGAFTLHLSNIGFAGLFALLQSEDPCTWYWINIVVDTTIGIYIQYLILRLAKRLAPKSSLLRFGVYGNPPRLSQCLSQIFIWQIICLSMKGVIVILMAILQRPLLFTSNLLLGALDPYPHAKLMVVMILTPMIMNTLQYWVTDNFIKEKSKNDGAGIPIYDALALEEPARDVTLSAH